MQPIWNQSFASHHSVLIHRHHQQAALTVLQNSINNFNDSAALLVPPSLTLQTVIIPADKTKEGVLIAAVATPWYEIVEYLKGDWLRLQDLDPRKLEEMVAAAWKLEGFEVVLTPRSGDGGRDVIATREDWGTIRLFDQVKRYAPHKLVTADELRSMIGTLCVYGNVSKGFITTTSGFAPGIATNAELQRYIPARIELKGGKELLEWLAKLADKGAA